MPYKKEYYYKDNNGKYNLCNYVYITDETKIEKPTIFAP
jgi:hypothetical protein